MLAYHQCGPVALVWDKWHVLKISIRIISLKSTYQIQIMWYITIAFLGPDSREAVAAFTSHMPRGLRHTIRIRRTRGFLPIIETGLQLCKQRRFIICSIFQELSSRVELCCVMLWFSDGRFYYYPSGYCHWSNHTISQWKFEAKLNDEVEPPETVITTIIKVSREWCAYTLVYHGIG